MAARHSILDDSALSVVLTGRPDHPPMRKKIEALLSLTGLHFNAVMLKPILFSGTTAQFKATAVSEWLQLHPSIRKVVLYDDRLENQEAIRGIVKEKGLIYEGHHVPG